MYTLTERELHAEMMDQPELDEGEHHRALSALERINVASGTARQFWSEISEFARRRSLQSLRILDVASGGGDVPWSLWNIARRQGVQLKITGIDVSSAACRFARQRCRSAEGDLQFQVADVLRQRLPGGFDVAISSLFLHHLPRDGAVQLLEEMASASRLLLVSDLRRCVSGYLLAQATCRLVTRSPVVHFDGPQSVRNAYSLAELRSVCHDAGLQGVALRRSWPCRMIVRYERS